MSTIRIVGQTGAEGRVAGPIGPCGELAYVETCGAGNDPGPEGTGERNGPLIGLMGSSAVNRFRAWSGRSGRRYVFSVFAIAPDGTGIERLPAESEAVAIIAEQRTGQTRRLLFVGQTGRCPEVFFRSERVQALAARGGCEIHLHLLAAGDREREAVVRDLAEAHPELG